ncbi:MAG: hypothetical protein ACLU38_07145 [Dysosmobacter sp.]
MSSAVQQHRPVRPVHVLRAGAAAVRGVAGCIIWTSTVLLPRKIIDLSPFHTSLFIANLASIETWLYPSPLLRNSAPPACSCAWASPCPDYMGGDLSRKVMPIGVVMVQAHHGYEYAAFTAISRATSGTK